MMTTAFKVVLDTNVLLASEKTTSATSPTQELLERWKREEFEVLYSEDILQEYIEKLTEIGVSEKSIKKLLSAIFKLGREVSITFYHFPYYPVDPDDIAFLLCAENGEATHLISYDKHLKAIEPFYSFRVCGTLEFLQELRQELANSFT